MVLKKNEEKAHETHSFDVYLYLNEFCEQIKQREREAE